MPFLPRGWLGCPNIGEAVGNLFIPMKTPLDSVKFQRNISKPNQFDVDEAISLAKNKARRANKRLTLWIDLTNAKSERYDSSKVSEAGIEYVRFSCEGRGKIPNRRLINSFVRMCASNRNEMILVHCTHGYNRTGFFICSYLIDNFHMSVPEALSQFEESRYPGILREEYLYGIADTFGEHRSRIALPSIPQWYLPVVEHDKAHPHRGNDNRGANRQSRQQNSSTYIDPNWDHNATLSNNYSGWHAPNDRRMLQNASDYYQQEVRNLGYEPDYQQPHQVVHQRHRDYWHTRQTPREENSCYNAYSNEYNYRS